MTGLPHPSANRQYSYNGSKRPNLKMSSADSITALPASDDSYDFSISIPPVTRRFHHSPRLSHHRRQSKINSVYSRLEPNSMMQPSACRVAVQLVVQGTWLLGIVAIGLFVWKKIFETL